MTRFEGEGQTPHLATLFRNVSVRWRPEIPILYAYIWRSGVLWPAAGCSFSRF